MLMVKCFSEESFGFTIPEQKIPLLAIFTPLTRLASVHVLPGAQPVFVKVQEPAPNPLT
jgi:hypothetical protein